MWCNLLDLNGTDSPLLILQGTLWPAYWTQIGPRFFLAGQKRYCGPISVWHHETTWKLHSNKDDSKLLAIVTS
jgi:hypothetical protein